MHIHISMCVHMYVNVYICVYVCMCVEFKDQCQVRCLPQSHFTLFFEMGSPTEAGAHWSGLQAPGICLSVSTSPALGLQISPTVLGFHVCSGIKLSSLIFQGKHFTSWASSELGFNPFFWYRIKLLSTLLSIAAALNNTLCQILPLSLSFPLFYAPFLPSLSSSSPFSSFTVDSYLIRTLYCLRPPL